MNRTWHSQNGALQFESLVAILKCSCTNLQLQWSVNVNHIHSCPLHIMSWMSPGKSFLEKQEVWLVQFNQQWEGEAAVESVDWLKMRSRGQWLNQSLFCALCDHAIDRPAGQDRGGGKLATLLRRTREYVGWIWPLRGARSPAVAISCVNSTGTWQE